MSDFRANCVRYLCRDEQLTNLIQEMLKRLMIACVKLFSLTDKLKLLCDDALQESNECAA